MSLTVGVFFNTIFVSSHMYPENPEETQVIVGSMNMGYISDTARNRTHNRFRPKREPIPLCHSDGHRLSHIWEHLLLGIKKIKNQNMTIIFLGLDRHRNRKLWAPTIVWTSWVQNRLHPWNSVSDIPCSVSDWGSCMISDRCAGQWASNENSTDRSTHDATWRTNHTGWEFLDFHSLSINQCLFWKYFLVYELIQ